MYEPFTKAGRTLLADVEEHFGGDDPIVIMVASGIALIERELRSKTFVAPELHEPEALDSPAGAGASVEAERG